MYTNRHEFLWKSEYSYREKGLIVLEGANYTPSMKNYETINVEGRNGALLLDKGTYSDRVLEFKIKYVDNKLSDDPNYADILIDWLINTNNDNRLCYNLGEDRCYHVKNVIIEDVENELIPGDVFKIKFICDPFIYSYTKKYLRNVKSPTNLNYVGTIPADTIIKIEGNGNIQLTINDTTVQINNVDGYVELNSKLFLCVNKDKTSKTRDMIGNFPVIKKGNNTISYTGDITNLTIEYNDTFR